MNEPLKKEIKNFLISITKYDIDPHDKRSAENLLNKLNKEEFKRLIASDSLEMRSRKLIINFLKEKTILIDKFLGVNSEYVTAVDLDEIMHWPLYDCIYVINFLGDRLAFLDCDPDICPWCIMFINNNCKGCQYGALYGNCKNDGNSKYSKLSSIIRIKLKENNIEHTNTPISSIPGMWELVKKYNKLCSAFIK